MARDLQAYILDVASDLFYRQGIKNTGVDAIVKAAGTTKMSLYKYYPSKDDLVLAHLHKSREAIRELLLQGLEKQADPQQKLLAIFDVFADLQADPSFRGCPFINAAAEFAEQGGAVQQAAADYTKAFRKLMADLARQAGIVQADELAGQLAMLIAGAMASEQIQKGSGAMINARKAGEILIAAAQAGASE
ncbi:MAG: helix-turn-helix domain containing protein [Methylomonas sp.]|nr:helix-turn-helix domain containing protein [Methylomonas sp.]